MKTKAALALSVAGILVTGSAALAVNTQVLNSTPAGTGNANSVLLPNSAGRTPAPASVVDATATPDAASVLKGGSTASAPTKAAASPEPGDDKGRRRTRPSTGSADDPDAKAATVTRNDEGGPGGSQSAGSAGSGDDAGPAGSRPAGTAGALPAAGNPAVVVPPGDVKGGLRTVQEPGDDKGGQSRTSEPGDGSGGHSSDD